jgi:hypothetical protein
MIESADEFRRLRASEDPAEYGRAAHDEASVEVWRDVVARFPDLRQWVAHNKTVPVEILDLLSTDPDSQVRATVAMKRKLPTHIQERLATDSEERVRQRLAFNAKAARSVLEHLACDPSPPVAERARARLSEDQG